MLNVFALGAVGGLLCGVVKHTCFPGTGKSSRPPATGSSMVDTTPEAGTRRKRITVLKENKLLAAGVGTLCACGVAAAFMVVRQQQCSRQPGTRSKARCVLSVVLPGLQCRHTSSSALIMFWWFLLQAANRWADTTARPDPLQRAAMVCRRAGGATH